MNWHELTHNCPYCKVQTRIVAISVNAEGKINLLRVCQKCGGKTDTPLSMEFLQKWAYYKDLQEFIERSELPYTTAEEKIADDKFLLEMKIDPKVKQLKE